MSGVAPVGPAAMPRHNREEELERIGPSSQPPTDDDKQPPAVEADSQKQAAKTTLLDFQYTGKGSFIDKVF